MIAVLVVAGVGTLVVLALTPILLPWPHRLRWLIASTMLPDTWSVGMSPLLVLDEVTVENVVPGHLDVVRVAASNASCPHSLSLAAVTGPDLARLRRWAAAGTPLLRVNHCDGEVTLHGPSWSVRGLRPVDYRLARVQPPRPGQLPTVTTSPRDGTALTELNRADLQLLGLVLSPPRPASVSQR